MYTFRRRSNIKEQATCYHHTDGFKLSYIEKQFLRWLQSWEEKIFLCNRTILHAKGKCLYSCSIDQKQKMESYFKKYQERSSQVIAQDRFVWSVFANAMITKHKHHVHDAYPCQTKLCLLLLLWSSFYLKLPSFNQVQDLLRELLRCTDNITFMFSFLPGMSMTSYISSFITDGHNENVLCDEFFYNLKEDIMSCQPNMSLFQCYSPLLLYFVENLTALNTSVQGMSNGNNKNTSTLSSFLNWPIPGYSNHTLLTLSLQHKDYALVTRLLQIGASAENKFWDPINEGYISAEQLMVTSINSLVATKYFFQNLNPTTHPSFSSLMNLLELVTVYGKMMRRSLLLPSSIKADNVWRGESWRQELNSEIADKWGIGYERSFPSLQHITKISIRQHILQIDKKLLLDSIHELPIPNMLKLYLNLELD